MKVLVLGAKGRTGRLIVRFRPGEGHSVVALVRSKASADLPGVDMIEGDARDEGTLTFFLVVKDAESPRLMHAPEAVPPMQRVDFSRVQEPT
jgi:uncharacterized protein YbjT (DUF2867 family)